MSIPEEIKHIIEAMSVWSAKHIIGIYGVVQEGSCALWGTATLLETNRRIFILSANHVLEDNHEFQYFGHSAGAGKPPRKIAEINRVADKDNDVVLIEVMPASVEGIGKKPILTDILAQNNFNLDDSDALFLQGFPGEWSEPKPVNQLKSRPLPLLVAQVEKERRLRSDFFFVHYDFAGNRDVSGNLVTVPSPNGLSGSSLWLLNWQQGDNHWKPTKAKLIGVTTTWYPDGKMLKATQSEPIQALINQILAM